MGQPVKISDDLLLDARLVGGLVDRSIAGQIEFWAKLGRAIEPLLDGITALALCRAGAAQPLSSCLRMAGTAAGKRALREYLKGQPYPHYEPVPDSPGLLVRIDANGKRSVGRFIRRRFVPERRRS
jgi:hypothetical protein